MQIVETGTKLQTRWSTKHGALALLLVWLASIGYLGARITKGWTPLDEGTLGLSAERVLNGELPHRDFDDYTGGLSYVHAFAFRVFGVSLTSMRIVLFLFFAAWVPAVFYIASRFHTPYFAGALTLVAVVWSVPRYTGPMPSWYSLFFATFGTAALLRFLEGNSRRWLFIAGICAGISVLVKIIASYFVAAVLLFLLFREQNMAKERCVEPGRAPLYKLAITLGLGVFLALLYRLIRQMPGISELVFFFLPSVCLAVLILAREFAGIPGRNKERFASLIGMYSIFLAAVAAPLVLFLIQFARLGAVSELFHGLVAMPVKIIQSASLATPNPIVMIAAIPFILGIAFSYENRRVARIIGSSLIALFGAAILLTAGGNTVAYKLGWFSLASAIPLLTLFATIKMWPNQMINERFRVGSEPAMLLLCVTALCSLVQFPFAPPIYFFYVAPLVLLCAAAVLTLAKRVAGFAFGLLLAFYLIFAVLPVSDYEAGARHTRQGYTEKLNMPRAGGLGVDPSDAQSYNRLISLVREHAEGHAIYAAPDCPEVYFLSGIDSPSRHYFDFFEDAVGADERALAIINEFKVNVVTINNSPRFSKPMSPALRSALNGQFPYFAEIGAFQVRWRE